MEIDFDTLSPADRYKVLASLVTPRPIAWVTTVDHEGRVNAAPFSFFNVFGSNPPIVAFAPGNKGPGLPKDTARNIRATKEFVVNIADEAIGEKMVATAESLPHGESEIVAAGLRVVPAAKIEAPRIAEAPVSLECREWATLEIGNNRLVIGTVHHVHVRDGLLDPETLRLDHSAYSPLGRMASPDWYCRTRDQFEMPRPD
ncbi:MAG: flavin reductase family protein [Akkermansiaceae bacterium]|nr:flavin reductase family protein [Akkermansiaceae bacterium]NNM30074.1 flavin reductase family protein [Akkermansiaceae bacterium]